MGWNAKGAGGIAPENANTRADFLFYHSFEKRRPRGSAAWPSALGDGMRLFVRATEAKRKSGHF
jgi:hypothetical protein